MKKLIRIIPITIIILLITVSCKQEYSGYDKTDSGLYYKFHTNIDDEKPVPGHILQLHLRYSTEDSLLFDDSEMSPAPIDILLNEPLFEGDINEGFAMMSKGDSASFIVDAESFFTYTANAPVPEFIEPESKLFFDIKLVDFMTEEEYVKEQERLTEEIMEQSAELARIEDEKLEDYLEEEDITTKPLESGLIYIEKEKGTGQPVNPGNTVKVHYEGKLIDGTVFDSSKKVGEPIEFVVGRGQVISGWDEGVSMMNVGGKARFIIPSHLAYGERGVQHVIPPFSTLIFDLEVVDIVEVE